VELINLGRENRILYTRPSPIRKCEGGEGRIPGNRRKKDEKMWARRDGTGGCNPERNRAKKKEKKVEKKKLVRGKHAYARLPCESGKKDGLKGEPVHS